MDSENEVTLGSEGGVIEKAHVENSVQVPDTKNMDVSLDNGEEEVLDVNGKSEHLAKPEGQSSKVAVEANAAALASKNSKTKKDLGSKMVKEKPNPKTTTPLLRTKKPFLSQSLSFPARAKVDSMKKSIDGYPVKTNFKQAQANGTKAEVRRASTGTNLKDVGGGALARRSSFPSKPTTRIQPSGKSTSPSLIKDSSPSDVSKPVGQNLKPVRIALQKEEDDAYSTTSSASRGRMANTSGFSFRLEERAEKRKEFFSKIEEKIQAKEAEKTNLQEKSKEELEAEIRQLRKTLMFKATPMPTFYKEPPPKVELKKTPTTRPISPKLGRNKNPVAVISNSSEGSPRSCLSPRLAREQNNPTKGGSKPLRKSQQKLQSQNTTNKPNAETAEPDIQNQSVNLPEPTIREIMHQQVSVGG